MAQCVLSLTPTDFHSSLYLNLEELLQLSDRTLKKSQVHKELAQIDLTYETALWATAALLGGGSALAMRKRGARTSLLARSKQNKTPGDPLTLNSWWKTGKEIKLQARRLAAINLPTLCPCKKKKKKTDKMWGTQKWTALYESILIFNKAIYTFLLELQVACRLPRACAIELTSVGNVLTAYIT